MTPARILVVDDEPRVRKLIEIHLGRRGYEVVGANDGNEALDALQRQPFALIVTDLHMPNLDGLALAQRLRADPATARIPVVMLSATKRWEDGDAPTEGVDIFLAKPLEMQALTVAVEKLLAA